MDDEWETLVRPNVKKKLVENDGRFVCSHASMSIGAVPIASDRVKSSSPPLLLPGVSTRVHYNGRPQAIISQSDSHTFFPVHSSYCCHVMTSRSTSTSEQHVKIETTKFTTNPLTQTIAQLIVFK